MKSKDLRKYKDEFIRLYKEGYSLRKIGDLYGVSKTSIKKYVKEDCELRIKGLTDEQKLKIKALYLEGFTVSAISKKMGTAYGTTKNYLSNEFGIVTNGIKKYEHLVDEIIKDYGENGLSASEIAEKYGISIQTVMNYIAESDIQARSYAETSRVYDLNEDYFNNLNSYKSEILGMISSKGRLYSTPLGNFLDINVHSSRMDVLNIIAKELYPNEVPKFNYVDNNIVLRISSKKIYDKLDEYGLHSECDKEYEGLPEGIDENSFWKGFVYAGITFTVRTMHISGYRKDIKGLSEYFNKLGIVFRQMGETGIVIENKKEIKKLIEIHNYSFIKTFVEKNVSNLDKDKKHSWNSILLD